jgi:hypothetical protein
MSKSDAFLQLQRQADNVKLAVNAISDSGAPELKLRVLVVADPSSGERDVCVQAASVAATTRQVGAEDSATADVCVKDEFPSDAAELLTGKDLNSRWAWLEDRCVEMAQSQDGTSEQNATKETAASVRQLKFVPKDGKKYVDPWREMSISCLRRDLKNAGQQLMSNRCIVLDDSANAEQREEVGKEGGGSLKGRADYLFGPALGIGLGASFDEATCQIDMAQALLESLRKKGRRSSSRRKKDSTRSPSPQVSHVESARPSSPSKSALRPAWNRKAVSKSRPNPSSTISVR